MDADFERACNHPAGRRRTPGQGQGARPWALLLCWCVLLAGCTDDVTSSRRHLELAKDWQDQGRLEECVAELKSALELDPLNVEARWLLGRIYVDLGFGEAAEKEIQRAREAGLAGSGWMIPLARAYILQGKGRQVLEEMILDLGEPVSVQSTLVALQGLAFLQEGRPQQARARFRMVLSVSPDQPDARLGLARLALDESQHRQAMHLIDGVLNDRPERVDAWVLKGEVLRAQGEPALALAAYDAALGLQAANVQGRLGRAEALIALGELSRALDDVNAAILLRPNFGPANYLRARILFGQQDLPAAQDALHQVVRFDPGHLPSQLLLGTLFYDQGDMAQAEQYLSTFLQANPAHLAARKLLAAAHMEAGRPDAAVALLKAALPHAPQDAQLLVQLGGAYLQARDHTLGADYLRKAIAIAPEVSRIGREVDLNLLAATPTLARINDAVDLGYGLKLIDILEILIPIQRQEFSQAVATAAGLAIRLPNHPIAHLLEGLARAAAGESAKARSAFQKALRLDPGLDPGSTGLTGQDL